MTWHAIVETIEAMTEVLLFVCIFLIVALGIQ